MGRLTRLLCLATALLLLPLCYGEEDQDYDMTTQDYGDYNATFDYSFYSNSSTEDLDKFLSNSEEEEEEPDLVDEGLKFEVTTITTVAGSTASRTSAASVSLLFSVALTLHLLPTL